ncbi:MAG TPA: MASE1 domain-containing protein [Polyangia bacterium]|nr:MASE1 domain-containing protein [Polyangia bacterium]
MSVEVRRLAAQGLELAVLFVAYAITARIGLSFDALGGIATTVWPPTGIALAALTLRGPRLWPAVFLAAFAVNANVGIPLLSALIIATGNTLEAVMGALLLRRFGFDSRLERLRDVMLIGIAALASTTVSATVGLLGTAVGHVPVTDSYPTFWAVWWVGDVLGNLLVAPLLFAWAPAPRIARRPTRRIEAVLLLIATTLVSVTFFRHRLAYQAIHGMVRGTYPIVPLLIWAALRFEQRGVTSALVLVAAIAVSGAAAGGGIFATESAHDRLLLVQSFMAVTAVSMLTLAAALAERRAAIGARDEFISIASHELKTPLTALKLRLGSAMRLGELLSAELPNVEKLTRAIGASNTTADRLGVLVDDLLDVSRLTGGRLALHLERISLCDLVGDVVGRMQEQSTEIGSRIEVDVPATIAGTWDRIRIEQVVTNLLSNAIKYGMGRPIGLSAGMDGSRVWLRVKDAGIGIPRGDQRRIFRAFERLATGDRVGGLGLGLYIGWQIAIAHAGTLSVESEPHAGATFTLDLPLQTPPRDR